MQSETTLKTDLSEGYRDTEVGPLPEEWEVIELAQVLARGPQNGVYKPQSLYGQGTLIVRIDSFGNEGGTIEQALSRVQLSAAEVQSYGLSTNDILVNRVNSLSHLGKTVLVGNFSEPVVFESNMMRFSVDTTRMVPEYVSRFLSTSIAREQVKGKAKRAVAQSSINQGDVKTISLILPPLSEQQAIVYVLRAVQKALEATEKVIEASRQLKRSLMKYLFTYGPVSVDEAEQVPLKETEIGRVPEHWEIGLLEDVVKVQTGFPFLSAQFTEDPTTETYPLIRIRDLLPHRTETFVSGPIDSDIVDKYKVHCGDVLIGMDGNFNVVLWSDQSGLLNQRVARLQNFSSIVSSVFIYYAIIKPLSKIEGSKHFTTVKHLSMGDLRSLPVPLPPLADQQQIAQILSTVDHKAEIERNRKQTLQVLFKTLLHNLMTGKIRVNDLDLSAVEEMV